MEWNAADGYPLEVVLAPSKLLRVVVTILVMASMPLCCCSFRSVGKCCSTGGGGPMARADDAGDRCVDEHVHCHGGHSHCDAPAKTTPCAPSPDDSQKCACGKSLTKMGVIGKPVVEISALALVAILPWPTMPAAESMPSQFASISAARPLEPPATTLLRQHCALNV